MYIVCNSTGFTSLDTQYTSFFCKYKHCVSSLHVAACECTCANADFLCLQIHKQAPPLEDVPESCSPAMRRLLEHALDRVPSQRSSATELLNEEALHPSREDQPRCWSLDSALEEGTHPLLRQHSQLSDSTQGTANTHTHSYSYFQKSMKLVNLNNEKDCKELKK